MIYRPLTSSATTGVVTIAMTGTLFGGVVISTDGTNAAVVSVRENDSGGKLLFSVSTKQPMIWFGPISSGSSIVYLSVTGTGASAFFYEAVN